MARKTKNTDVVAASPLVATDVEKMILVIRDKQVLLDRDLATLYGVATKVLNQAVKRNVERFPERNCFRLNSDENRELVTNCDRFKTLKHSSSLPTAFTEQGVAMLATILHSETAIRVSLQIMDAFVSMRHFLMHNGGLVNRLVRVEGKEIEQDRRLLEHDHKIDSLFEAMDRRETDLKKVMENIIDPSTYRHFLILNGRKLEADVAYAQIYGMAKKSVLIVDNYVDVKTLNLLRNVRKGVSILIASDRYTRLTDDMLNDYRAAMPGISIDKVSALHKFHDRYILVDFKTKSEKLYHCGASSKDAGNKITTIVRLDDVDAYRNMFEEVSEQPRG
ncbi:MAG: ORF6N domain-containing protein [Fibrobacter sp.]|nr:ORF6N domain-containing protein [Fibrobacter sp.]MBR3850602.1 ORF6N domain-containing protein [Fibrobacter sp.]